MISLKNTLLLLVLVSLLCLMGCFRGENVPDVSDIEVDFESVDYDDLFLALDSKEQLSSDLSHLESKYPDMTKLYLQNIMNFKRRGDTTDLFLTDIRGFLESPYVESLKQKVDSVFSERNELDRDFEVALKYLKFYFPEAKIPRIYYLFTEYSYAAFLFPDGEGDGLGISLDMFLGKEYPYKQFFPTNPAFSSYLTASFDPAYVTKKGIAAVVEDMVGPVTGSRLIDEMINNGKKQIILKKLLPQKPDTILWEYTLEQMDWVRENELNIYAYLTSEELLFSTDQMKFMKYVRPSPNSPGMPEGAPGRTANYIGYKIVESYLNQSGSSLVQMLEEKDTQKILNIARYKPSI